MSYRLWIVSVLVFMLLAMPVAAAGYNEAPMLAEKVAAGTLPQVDERLPMNPMVLEPWNEIGQYGGTWNRRELSTSWAGFRTDLYSYSFIRWIDDGKGIAPNLVADWDMSEDGKVWTLFFREGMKWSDGHPFTVDDVLYWWGDMALNREHPEGIPDWAVSGLGENVNMVKINDYTLRLEYPAPEPILLERLATWPNGGINSWNAAPKHYLMQFNPRYNDEYTDYETHMQMQEWWTNPESPNITPWVLVEERPGERALWERNPFYWGVDPDGNQLPYIDQISIRMEADAEIIKLAAIQGEIHFAVRPMDAIFSPRDIPMMLENEASGNYETLMYLWGVGSAVTYYTNRNHLEPAKAELYRNPQFNRALSHALDRDEMNRVVFFGMGYPTTGTFHEGAVEYNRTPEGQQIFQEWRDSAIAYDPEKAMSLLDGIGVVDQSGDGWRDMPDGSELRLRIDMNVGSREMVFDINEMTQEFWQAIGLRTDVNPIPGAQLGIMTNTQTYDIHGNRPLAEGPNHLIFPQWLVPIDNAYWGALEGTWYSLRTTDAIHEDLDAEPRDRVPARKDPAEDEFIATLQDLYDRARQEVDDVQRDFLVHEMIRLHMEHGPIFIGTVGNTPAPILVRNDFKNVPRPEQLGWGGMVAPWTQAYGGQLKPETFYIEQ